MEKSWNFILNPGFQKKNKKEKKIENFVVFALVQCLLIWRNVVFVLLQF